MSAPRTIGIIAGNGVYPETFIAAARAREPGSRLAMAAFENETEPENAARVDSCAWFRVGQFSRLIRFFKAEGVREAVMVGQIAPKNLFDLRPDIRTLMLLARIRERNAETLFGGIAEELGKEGISILLATTFLEDHLPEPGHVCGPVFRKRQLEDAAFGFGIVKQTSAMDIGQSIVVRHGTVLAVEAFEGTDACIARGGELGRRKNTMLVKVSKPNQDFRFDVPVIGPRTIENCHRAGISAIAVEARRTMVLQPETVARLCAEHRIGVHAIE